MATQAAQIFKTNTKPPLPSKIRDDKGKGKAPLSGVKTGQTDKSGLKLKSKA